MKRFLVGLLAAASLACAQNCRVDEVTGLPPELVHLEATVTLGSPTPLTARQVRNLLLTLRRADNRFVGTVGIVNGQASRMRVSILGSAAIGDPDLREALTCLVRGWKEPCGLLCENEYQPIPVEVLAGQGYEGWLELARQQTWGFLGVNRSAATVLLGGKTPGGILLVESPQAGDVVLMGSLFANSASPSTGGAGGIKAPALVLALKTLLRWDEVKAQSRPYRP
jgi:hypothetical protein